MLNKKTGSGLGLMIAKLIFQYHQIEITLEINARTEPESNQAEFSNFKLTLISF